MLRIVSYHEKEILSQLASKEKEGFDFVYNALYERLLFFARRFVILETAEDILSETFTKLWQRNDRFQSLSEVEQWLRVTLRNGCIDHLRKKNIMEGRQEAYQQFSDQHYEDLYFRTSLEAELMDRVVKEIEKLPPLTANILKLSFLKGLNVDEISSQLNINKQVVYNKKSLGIKALRLSISDKKLALTLMFISPMLTSQFSI